jgi:hypothetical protein
MKIVTTEGNIKSAVIANTLTITSGSIVNVGGESVLSGSIASGSVCQFHLSSGTINSGHIGPGAIMGWKEDVNAGFMIYSGTIGPNDIGSGAIQSGQIGSNVGGNEDFSSGTIIAIANSITPLTSGFTFSLNTEEAISGGKAVSISQSGYLRIAMAGVSGRMPAIGILIDNIVSGSPADVYVHGTFCWNSALAAGYNYSGAMPGEARGITGTLVVGRSGQILPANAPFTSGFPSVLSGDLFQRLGMVIGTSGIASIGTITTSLFSLNISPICWSGASQAYATL